MCKEIILSVETNVMFESYIVERNPFIYLF